MPFQFCCSTSGGVFLSSAIWLRVSPVSGHSLPNGCGPPLPAAAATEAAEKGPELVGHMALARSRHAPPALMAAVASASSSACRRCRRRAETRGQGGFCAPGVFPGGTAAGLRHRRICERCIRCAVKPPGHLHQCARYGARRTLLVSSASTAVSRTSSTRCISSCWSCRRSCSRRMRSSSAATSL